MPAPPFSQSGDNSPVNYSEQTLAAARGRSATQVLVDAVRADIDPNAPCASAVAGCRAEAPPSSRAVVAAATVSDRLSAFALHLAHKFPTHELLRRAKRASWMSLLSFGVSKIAHAACATGLGAPTPALAAAAASSTIATRVFGSIQGAVVRKGTSVSLSDFTKRLETSLRAPISVTMNGAALGTRGGVMDALRAVSIEVAVGLRMAAGLVGDLAAKLRKSGLTQFSAVDLCRVVLTKTTVLVLVYAGRRSGTLALDFLGAYVVSSS